MQCRNLYRHISDGIVSVMCHTDINLPLKVIIISRWASCRRRLSVTHGTHRVGCMVNSYNYKRSRLYYASALIYTL